MTGKERREMLRLKVSRYVNMKIKTFHSQISKFSVFDKERAKKNDRIFGEVLIPTTHPLTEKKGNLLKALE